MSKQFGKYLLLEKLAVGGMANIYLAEYSTIEGFKKELVVKKILSKFSSNEIFTSMFIDEAKIAVNLNHRNIVQTFDFGKVEKEYYITMEYIEGFDLFQIFKYFHFDKTKIDEGLVIFILMEILKGLDYIHDIKNNKIGDLIHRDISLGNIIISTTGEIKILDFGVAKSSESGFDELHHLKGKRSYMAPEQILRKELDGRIDIYALGIIAWRLLTGEKQSDFSDINSREELLEVVIPDIIDINPNISTELSKIIMKALEKDRDKRYLRATDFYNALHKYSVKTNKLISYFDFVNFININKNRLRTKNSSEVTLTVDANETFLYEENNPNEKILNQKKDIIFIYCDFKILESPYNNYSALEVKQIMEIYFKLISNVAYKTQISVVSLEHDSMIFALGAISKKENDTLNSLEFSLKIKELFESLIKDYKLLIKISIMIEKGEVILSEIKNMQIRIRYVDNLLRDTRRKLESFPEGVFVNFSLNNDVAKYFEYYNYKNLLKIKKLKDIKELKEIKETDKIDEIILGRDKELIFLKDRLDNSINNRKPSFNYLIGEAGIGKTLLSEKLYAYLEYTYNNFYFINVKVIKSDLPYDILRDILRDILKIKTKKEFEFQIKEILSSIEINRKDEIMILLGSFLEFDYSEEKYIKRLKKTNNIILDLQLKSLLFFFRIISNKKNIVLFIEDYHLLSYLDLKFFDNLIKKFKSPLFLLAIARKEFLQKNIKIDKKVAIINLKRLSYESSLELINTILVKKFIKTNIDEEALDFEFLDSLGPIVIDIVSSKNQEVESSEELSKYIYSKSSGNPFYIKEIINFFKGKEIIYLNGNIVFFDKEKLDNLNFPFSLETILQSEFDKLNFNEKIVLQRASIFGSSFWTAPLIHILGDNIINILEKLEIKGFLYKRKVDKILDIEYIFKHPLLRDIIYYSISEKRRKDYHSQLAMIFLNYQRNCLNRLIAKQFENAEQYDNAANYYLLAANNSLHLSFLNKTLIFYDEYHNIFNLTKKNWDRYLKVAQKRLSIHKFLGNSKKAEDIIKEIEKVKQKIS